MNKFKLVLLLVFCLVYSINRNAQATEDSVADHRVFHLVHVHGYVSSVLKQRPPPAYWGPRNPIVYVLNAKDTIILEPSWRVTFIHPVKKIEIIDILIANTDTLHIACILQEFKQTTIMSFALYPQDTIPEFVSFMAESEPQFFKKPRVDTLVLVAPDIKTELLRGIRNLIPKAEKRVIDLRKNNPPVKGAVSGKQSTSPH
jgi:hypothetical protein